MVSEFEHKVRAALKHGHPSSPNLSAFALDVEHYLEQSGLFSEVRTKKTGEPERALLITCRVADPATTPDEVAKALRRIWEEAPLGYGGDYDAFELQASKHAAQLDFVTVSSYGAIVTGRIVATGFQ